jgi:hypothetical protein
MGGTADVVTDWDFQRDLVGITDQKQRGERQDRATLRYTRARARPY